ncbi:MmgE/PrpD family protein [Leucobacter sp. USHLN153]|uniref:MmgE/PrpD family protein n=1 Tax=Leucobacter sp. USHLN153 TaxID=3081268 RepID=UPI00301AD0A5
MSSPSWEEWQHDLFARVSGLRAAELDEATRRRAALIMVDDLAAMVLAAHEPEIQRLNAAAQRIAPLSEASVIGGGRSGRSWAALTNATAACWNELDGGFRPATCHGGLYSLPAGMAEVEANGGTVGQVMRALVGGYEVSTSFARAVPFPSPLQWHPHATLAPTGAAAAVAVARGGSAEDVASASFAAVTLAAAGPFSHATSGLLIRNGWAGHGALSGFTAVELAAAGVRADAGSPLEVLQSGFGNEISVDALQSGTGDWAVHDGYHKLYACCQYMHSAVEASRDLATGPLADVATDQIARIAVETHPLALPLTETEPTTALGAKFSMPHTVASVLVNRHTRAETFGAGQLENPEIAALRPLVEVTRYPGELAPPLDRPARITVTLHSGESFTAECLSAIGGPDRPLSESDVIDKIDRLTSSTAPRFAAVAEQLVAGRIATDEAWSDVLGELWASA